jgi:type II secretory pathway component GspD/PulD (secretin)
VLIAEMAEPLTQPTATEVLDMERRGKLVSNARVRLLSLENQPAFAQFGEMAARVVGRTTTGLAVTPIYNSVNVGTMLQATSRVEPDGTLLVQVSLEKSALVRSQDAPERREPEAVTRMHTQSTIRLKPGEPTVLSAGPTNGEDAASQTWILVTGTVR